MQSRYHIQEALYRMCSDEWQCAKQIVGKTFGHRSQCSFEPGLN